MNIFSCLRFVNFGVNKIHIKELMSEELPGFGLVMNTAFRENFRDQS